LTHADIVYQTTSAEIPIQSLAIWVFPNPSDDGLFQINKEVKWEAYNTIGTRINKGYGNAINLSDQKMGFYLIKVENQVIKLLIK
jgi:outer membrane biogenesis lipoprotein LolB